MRQEVLCGRVEERAARSFPTSRRPDPARFHQHVERTLADLDAADRLDFGPADWLMIGDDGQCLGRGPGQAPGIFTGSAKDVRKVGRRLKVPATAPLDQFDSVPGVAFGKTGKRGPDVAFPDVSRDVVKAERRFRGKYRCFDCAFEGVHYPTAFRTSTSPKISACSMWSRPCRASSSAATKLLASADFRYCGSLVSGRNASSVVQSSAWPSSAATRWIASSSVITARWATTCMAGAVRAFTRP